MLEIFVIPAVLMALVAAVVLFLFFLRKHTRRRIMVIRPFWSQLAGLVVSICVGIGIYLVLGIFLSSTLNFEDGWGIFKYLGDVLATLVGIPLGTLAAYETFARRLRDVPVNKTGLTMRFGAFTGGTYDAGRHWVPPFTEILTLPGSTEKFILEILGEKIEAKDGNQFYFGMTENGGKANQIEYSISDALPYILVDDPEKSLSEAYMEAARLFFGQATEAAGVRNEGRLFPDFLMLKSWSTEFETRLRGTEFKDSNKNTERLFKDDAIDVLKQEAGKFLEKTASWGITVSKVFIPNIRENPEVQAAVSKRQIAEENAAALDVKVNAIKSHTADMQNQDVTPDFALAALLKLGGEDIEIVYRNVPEFMGAMPGMPANQSRRRGNHGNQQGRNRKGSGAAPRD